MYLPWMRDMCYTYSPISTKKGKKDKDDTDLSSKYKEVRFKFYFPILMTDSQTDIQKSELLRKCVLLLSYKKKVKYLYQPEKLSDSIYCIRLVLL